VKRAGSVGLAAVEDEDLGAPVGRATGGVVAVVD